MNSIAQLSRIEAYKKHSRHPRFSWRLWKGTICKSRKLKKVIGLWKATKMSADFSFWNSFSVAMFVSISLKLIFGRRMPHSQSYWYFLQFGTIFLFMFKTVENVILKVSEFYLKFSLSCSFYKRNRKKKSTSSLNWKNLFSSQTDLWRSQMTLEVNTTYPIILLRSNHPYVTIHSLESNCFIVIQIIKSNFMSSDL